MHSKYPSAASANISISVALAESTCLCVDQEYESFCQRPYWSSLHRYFIFNKICYKKHFCISYFSYVGYLHGNEFFSLEIYSLPGAIIFPLKNYNDVTEANQKRKFCLKTVDAYRVVLIMKDSRYPND